MTKTIMITLFVGVFAATGLLAAGAPQVNPTEFGYNVDEELHSSIKPSEFCHRVDVFGYSGDEELHSLLSPTEFGYNVDEELHSSISPTEFGYNVDEELHS